MSSPEAQQSLVLDYIRSVLKESIYEQRRLTKEELRDKLSDIVEMLLADADYMEAQEREGIRREEAAWGLEPGGALADTVRMKLIANEVLYDGYRLALRDLTSALADLFYPRKG